MWGANVEGGATRIPRRVKNGMQCRKKFTTNVLVYAFVRMFVLYNAVQIFNMRKSDPLF